jgi:(2R)-sulfolactate sulfo-lyase subunit alpha
MKYGILLHDPNDDVGVAVTDLADGEEIGSATLEGESTGPIHLVQNVPLGHKVALKDIPQHSQIREYGRTIGCASQPIKKGEHVHVHNIRTLRWSP